MGYERDLEHWAQVFSERFSIDKVLLLDKMTEFHSKNLQDWMENRIESVAKPSMIGKMASMAVMNLNANIFYKEMRTGRIYKNTSKRGKEIFLMGHASRDRKWMEYFQVVQR